MRPSSGQRDKSTKPAKSSGCVLRRSRQSTSPKSGRSSDPFGAGRASKGRGEAASRPTKLRRAPSLPAMPFFTLSTSESDTRKTCDTSFKHRSKSNKSAATTERPSLSTACSSGQSAASSGPNSSASETEPRVTRAPRLFHLHRAERAATAQKVQEIRLLAVRFAQPQPKLGQGQTCGTRLPFGMHKP